MPAPRPEPFSPLAAATRRRAGACAGLLLLAAAGCGRKGAPLPPEPRGPLPPREVTVRQSGERVVVAFRVPPARGERQGQLPARAEVLRVSYPPGTAAPPDPAVFRRRGVPVGRPGPPDLSPGGRRRVEDDTVGGDGSTGAGWLLRYAVRVFDRRGRGSPLVVAPDLVLASPPRAPTGLAGEATADGVRLTWEVPPDGSPAAGFNLYRSDPGSAPGEQPLNDAPLSAPEYLDADVETGRAYVYEVRTAATADRPYRESESSAPLRLVARDRFAPAAPRGFVAVQEGTAVRLFWTPSAERDLAGYRVYRSVGDDAWRRIGPDPLPRPLLLDSDVEIGERLRYYVTAVDRADPPNESGPSETRMLVPAPEPPAEGPAANDSGARR